jgi:hypothetical protein
MPLATIPRQNTLPLATAVRIVARGIRLRLGRSLVTLAGVALGIAFLMAAFTAEALRRGVADEDAQRESANRAYGVLLSETGPLRGRRLGLVVAGPPSDGERRLLARIKLDEPRVLESSDPEFARDASAILVMGGSELPLVDWARVRAAVRQPLFVLTSERAVEPPRGFTLVRTAVPAPVEDQEKRGKEARLGAVRTRSIVLISLLVTVMGIANAMLMSVTERFRDIGTMKCLGALSSLVRTLFLLEAAFMGAVGGLAGVAGGLLFTLVTYALPYGLTLVLGALVQGAGFLAGRALLSFGAGVALAVVAALYPAGVAARMVPADALRSNV